MTDFWKIEMDKTGNGLLLRFLRVNGEDMLAGRVWSHETFQDKGGWYIENSLTTLGQKGVSEENTRLWNTGVDSDKEIVQKKKEKNYLTILTSMLLRP